MVSNENLAIIWSLFHPRSFEKKIYYQVLIFGGGSLKIDF